MLRSMTSLYILNDDEILLLYRIGSRVIEPSYVGIGGHFEAEEFNDPQACVLRELKEETGLTLSNIENLTMRYVSLRHTGQEIRQNFYFFAQLKGILPETLTCNEGRLAWKKLSECTDLPMPVTAKSCMKHYLKQGQFDHIIYGTMHTADQEPVIVPLTKEET